MAQYIHSLDTTTERSAVARWLRRSIRTIGPGFHFDTPPDQYIDQQGRQLLSAADADRLARGLEHASTILGSDAFENVCLEEVWRGLGVEYDPVQDRLVPVGS